MANGYDGSIRIDTSINSSGFNSGIRAMTGAVGGLAAVMGAALSAAAVIAFGKSAVDAASEMSSAFVGLKSILDGQGKSFSNAKKFVSDYVSDGLIPATNAITAYKNLAGRGYNTDQIQQTLIALKNSSAFGRQASLTMGQAVQSATEGLKNENSILVDNAGVTKNVSVMWKEYAASIGTTADKLTKEQKILAEVNGILYETRFQMGDSEKLSGTYAGKVAMLSQAFLDFKVAVGNAIIPVLAQLIPYVTAAIKNFTVLFNIISQYIQAWFGYDPSANMSAYEGATQGAANAQGELAKQTEKAGKAAKGALAGFDELNVLQQDNSSTAGSVGSNVNNPVEGVDTGNPLNEMFEKIKVQVDIFKAGLLDFFQPTIDAFGRLQAALAPLGKTIWEGLQWAWENVLVPFGEWAIESLLPSFFDLLSASIDLLNEVLKKIQPVWLWLWDYILEPSVDTAQKFLIEIIDAITGGIRNLTEVIKTGNIQFTTIVATIGAVVIALAILAGGASIVIIAISALVAAIVALVYYWPEISKVASDAWTTITQLWYQAGWWFQTNVIDPIKKYFDIGLKWIQDAWTNTFNGIRDFVKGTINTIIDYINGMISAIATGLNSVIGGLNSLRVNIPSWVPVYGGQSWGVSLATITTPQIPRLATGAVIPPNAEFAAILGDQRSGRNIEAPEGLIRQIIQEEIGNIESKVTIEFGTSSLSALVRELKPYIDKENTRVGGSLIKGSASI